MPLTGAGDKSRVNDFTTNASSGIKLTALQLDNEFDDIDTALDLAFYRDGRATATGDFVMGGNQITGLGDAGADADAVSRSFGDARYLLKAQLAAGMPINASITSSVGSSALTIALKGADGNDPSSSNPVLLPFRSATATTGTVTVRTVTAATSLVISNGSKLGTVNSASFRIWVLAFDDAGTVRLAAYNSYATNSATPPNTSIKTIAPNAIASSTAEGGSGGADSAQVFYTGTAVTSKPYIILGYLDFDGGLATAGAWSSDATTKQNYYPGLPLPGQVLQRVANSASQVSGTTTLPIDFSIPQSNEGVQLITASITPFAKMNQLNVTFSGPIASSSTEAHIAIAMFKNSTADAIISTLTSRDAAANQNAGAYLYGQFLAESVSSTTFKIRAGTNGAGTTTGATTVFLITMVVVLLIDEVSV